MAGNEEALFGFMRDLGGQWCSRRRKRRIVNASILGDALPVGWKLLLGLKRREGRASVYCRRYLRHYLSLFFTVLVDGNFVSCKELSAYLQSYFGGLHDAHLTLDKDGDIAQQVHQMVSENGGIVQKEDDRRWSDEHEKEVNLLAPFVISSEDYKEYNGHVGIHVRNYVRGIEDSPGLLTLPRRTEVATRQESAPRISKMDALIEIEQNSILETTTTVPRYELNDGLSPDKLNAASNPEIPASTSDHEMNSDSPLSESGTEDDMTYRSVNKDLCQQNSEPMILNEKTED
ncbi:hypothetical protein POUND7_016138 [Theobroma cacao]